MRIAGSSGAGGAKEDRGAVLRRVRPGGPGPTLQSVGAIRSCFLHSWLVMGIFGVVLTQSGWVVQAAPPDLVRRAARRRETWAAGGRGSGRRRSRRESADGVRDQVVLDQCLDAGQAFDDAAHVEGGVIDGGLVVAQVVKAVVQVDAGFGEVGEHP